MRNKTLIIIILVAIMTLFIASFIIPFFSEYSIYEQSAFLKYAKPSVDHILGNDYLGRDMLVRLCLAIRNSIFIAVCSIPVSVLLGIIYGAYAGYASAGVERTMTATMNVFESISEFLLAILLMVIFTSLDI